MKFPPKTREEALTVKLLEKGNYPFIVLKAENKISQSNNPMIQLLLKIWDEKGREHLVYDLLMESLEFKLRHFCYAIGHGEMSENGEIDCELIKGKQGECKIYIQEDKSGKYPPKNAVADYLIPMDNVGNLTLPKNKTQNSNEFEDECPF